MDTFSELIARWRRQAEEYGRDGALVRGDALLRRCADELEAAFTDWELEGLSLERASDESGYSYGHLQRMVAGGQLENVGEEGAPRVRRADLPKKPRRPTAEGSQDPVDDILARRAAR